MYYITQVIICTKIAISVVRAFPEFAETSVLFTTKFRICAALNMLL